MDLMTIILSCAFNALNDDVLQSIAQAQSGGMANYVRPYGEPNGIEYRSEALAQRAIDRIKKSHKGVYIGLMGVPEAMASKYDIAPKELLDHCTNMTVASAILSELEDNCKRTGAPESVTCALEKYAMMTEKDPYLFTEKVIYGAIVTPNAQGDIPDKNNEVSNDLFWQPNSAQSEQNSLFFNVDIGSSYEKSDGKIAKDLEE